jgi:hypothetical protein
MVTPCVWVALSSDPTWRSSWLSPAGQPADLAFRASYETLPLKEAKILAFSWNPCKILCNLSADFAAHTGSQIIWGLPCWCSLFSPAVRN